MLVQKFPKASPEKHLLRGFSMGQSADRFQLSMASNLPLEGLLGGCRAARLVLETRIQKYGTASAMSLPKKASKKTHRNSEIIIPDKLYFRIGEVATLCRLPAYVLRFWETEFPQLKPIKSSTGQRMYRKRDVESVVRIKKLLYEDGFTIAGARVQLRDEIKSDRTQTALPFPINASLSVAHLRNELQQILHILSPRR
jgi:DNA-binding transcriptional MerR regulator